MANPFAYDEYRKDKIRQKIEESRTQRVQIKVRSRCRLALRSISGTDLIPSVSRENLLVYSTTIRKVP